MIFFKAYKFKNVLSLHVHMVFLNFLVCFVPEENKYNFSACLFETHTNSENCLTAGFHVIKLPEGFLIKS